MKKTRTEMSDGRYMIFYTFEDELKSEEESVEQKDEPETKALGEEKKDV